MDIDTVLCDKLNYTRILIGSYLSVIGGETHR